MLVSGTLANRANAGFEPTPERYAQLIARNLLAFAPGRLRPDEAYTVLEPCIGVGDLAAPVAAFSGVRLYAVEQDPQRAAVARERFPEATILTADLGAVRITPASMSLALCNFPYGYDGVLGGRLEYQMLKQVTETLMPGGILVTIVPARSGWDSLTIAYVGKHYERVQAWRFFDDAPNEAERFATFTQIVVMGIKRAQPLLRGRDEIKQTLKGWQWRAQAGWVGVPPEPLPLAPIAQPYHVPPTTAQPVMRSAVLSEADILAEEALASPKAEIGQADLVWVVGEAGPAEIGDAVGLAVDDELVEMRVAPAEGDLDDGVQLGDGCRIGDQQATPDQWTDSVEPDAELVDSRGGGGGHTAPHHTGAASQGVMPNKEGNTVSLTTSLPFPISIVPQPKLLQAVSGRAP